MVVQIFINLGPGNDTLSAGKLDPVEAAAVRIFYASLGPGRDVAVGAPVPNVIHGGQGRDLLMGGPDEDDLFGGGQNDFMVGLGGNDLLQCGKGNNDIFNDGPGKDLVNVRACEHRTHKQFAP
jgi:Ca2+-binding RTX toxin-like protein